MIDDDSGADEVDRGDRFPNPYLAASILPPGRDRMEAVEQFLEEEQHRLHERLVEMETDDGSIPDGMSEEWAMAKGKLDQTRLFYGLAVKGLLNAEMEQEENDE